MNPKFVAVLERICHESDMFERVFFVWTLFLSSFQEDSKDFFIFLICSTLLPVGG